eukprot:9109267-Alexandrium_andersonii.AAC.1
MATHGTAEGSRARTARAARQRRASSAGRGPGGRDAPSNAGTRRRRGRLRERAPLPWAAAEEHRRCGGVSGETEPAAAT